MLILQRSAALVAVAAVVAGALVGCNKSQSDTSSVGDALVSGNIATVNDTNITKSDFFTELQAYRQNPNQPQQPAGRSVLHAMIENVLVEQMARDQNVYPTNDQIDDQFKNFQMLQETQSVKPFADQLSDIGLTPDQAKTMMVVPQLCQLNLMAKDVTVTDSEINAFYDQNKAVQFTVPNRAHIKRMVLSTQSDANKVYASIQTGSTFDQEFPQSIDKQDPGGDVDQWISTDSSNPQNAALIDAINNTAVGKVSQPFQFQGTWWIIDVVDKRPRMPQPLDSVKSMIRIALLQKALQQNPAAQQQFGEEMRSAELNARITLSADMPQYAPVVADIQNPPIMSPGMPPPSAATVPSAPKKS